MTNNGLDEAIRELEAIIDVTVDIALTAGIDPDIIRNLFEKALGKPREEALPVSKRARIGVAERDLLADIVGEWHRNDQFIDECGDPVPLQMEHGPLSLKALYEIAASKQRIKNTSMSFEEATKALLEHKSLKEISDNEWVPTETVFTSNTETAVEVLPQLNYLAVFAETIQFNLKSKAGEGRKLARADARGFPLEKLSVLKAMVNDGGMDFLQKIDEFIVSESDKSTSLETAQVGAGFYLFAREESTVDK